jgi:exo-poly-alpha-galacturonosidase
MPAKLKLLLLVCLISIPAVKILAATKSTFNLMIAPGTVTNASATLLWDKQALPSATAYEIWVNDKLFGKTIKTNFTICNLVANTWYVVKIKTGNGPSDQLRNEVRFKTTSKGKVLNIIDFGAKADTAINNTIAIQAAINACTAGGTVYIPAGTFKSGALFLKSDMTLYIEKGGVLKGSTKVGDYMPMIYNRFEGWELNTYASLLNAGKLSRDGGYVVKNLRITGEGTISGGGRRLGDAMIKANGMRSRGRLICLMNCQNVSISKLTITEPPSWTIHYIYSDKISCHDLNIITRNIRNGDGIDPDSSTDSYIFNCTFDTGDDCIAIKSGKNPEGFLVAKPTKNVRITNCDFIRGHGISIGSEMSGGVSDVLVQDCKAGALLHGMQIKATKDRGGYVRNVIVSDCELQQITIFSAVNYNNDGEPAPILPVFENFIFKNIDLSTAGIKEPVININGFKDPAHKLRNVSFSNISLPENAQVVVNDSEKVKFEKVQSLNGIKPKYVIANSSEVLYK